MIGSERELLKGQTSSYGNRNRSTYQSQTEADWITLAIFPQTTALLRWLQKFTSSKLISLLPIPHFLHSLEHVTLRHNPSFFEQLHNGGQLQASDLLLAVRFGTGSTVTDRTPVRECKHPVRHCPACETIFLHGPFFIKFCQLSFLDQDWRVHTAAFTLENIGWHPCSNSLVRLPEYCAESCGGVKVEADFKIRLVRKSSDTPTTSRQLDFPMLDFLPCRRKACAQEWLPGQDSNLQPFG